MEFNDLSDKAILKELGARLTRYRLNRNMTQASLASEAGVSRATVQRVENGIGIALLHLILILRVLNLTGNLDALAPEPAASPLQRLQMSGKIRKRAWKIKKKKNGPPDWNWGPEQ